jgi:peptidoglycan/LPS O-acetylase OafA/YrhL
MRHDHGGDAMKKALALVGWFFLAIDATAILFFLHWAFTATTRDGESAYAIVFLLLTLVYVGVGGGALKFSSKRGSALGLWCSTLFLGLPPVIVATIRITNSL